MISREVNLSKYLEKIFETLKFFENDLNDYNKRVIFKLTMTIFFQIDPVGVLYDTETNIIKPIQDSIFNQELCKEENRLKLKGMQSLISLRLSCFYSSIKKEETKLVEEQFKIFNNGISDLSELFSSVEFINDDSYPYYIQSIAETLETCLTQKTIFIWIETRMSKQEETFSKNKKNTTILGESNRFFENFLNFISSIYRKNPHLSIEFLKTEKRFLNKSSEFVKSMTNINKRIHVGTFKAFIHLLTSFVGDKKTSDKIYQYLKEEGSQLISWDKFFDEMGYFRRSVPLNLKDDIEEYLYSILSLIIQICDYSLETSKLFLENTKWNVLPSIFGLIQCPFEQKVKGKVFRTLASFHQSPDARIFIWNQLEASKIVDYEMKFAGIIYQYEEIETRKKEFDVTIGFLELINLLIKQGIPNTLGTDYRVPGFGPYLKFIIEVFYSSFSKSYNSKLDQWKIISTCLEIFHTILEVYEPKLEDFKIKYIKIENKDVIMDKPPGFIILRDLLNNGTIKKVLTKIISDGSIELANERISNHGDEFEKSILIGLQIIDLLLVKKDIFIQLSQNNMKSEHFDNIPFSESLMKIVTFLDYLSPQMKYLSSNILFQMSQMDDKLITKKEDIDKLKKLLIKKLSGEDEIFDPESTFNFDNEMRIRIIDSLLLKNSLSIKLCGYKLYSESQILSSGDHCLELVLSLIMSENFLITYPQLSSKCLELIHKLCGDQSICHTTIDYLQSFEFFKKNIIRKDISNHFIYSLKQKEFILKILSEYILIRSLKEQKTSLQEIIDILFGQKKSKESLEQKRNYMIDLLESFQIPLIKFEKVKINLDSFYDENLKQFKIKSIQKHLSKDMNEKEVREILIQVEKMNNHNLSLLTLESCYQGWGQACEVILLKCFDMVDKDNRERILFDLSNSLLLKITVEGIPNTLEELISKTILRIIQSFKNERLLNQTTQILPVEQALSIYSDLLKASSKDRISQETKINLYSSLLVFLQFTKVNPIQESKYREGFQSLTPLITIKRMIHNALHGKDILKTIIYSLLDELMVYDSKDRRWEQSLLKEGIINHLMDSLNTCSNSFIDLLDPNKSSNTSNIYIYECLMSLFIRISRILPETAIIIKLSSFKFINEKNITEDNEERFNFLLLPILQLISSIFIQYKTNEKYARQVATFINEHHKIIRRILKSRNYQHISFISSLFYILATYHSNIFNIQIEKNIKYEELFHNILKEISQENDKYETITFIIGFFSSLSKYPTEQKLGREIFTPKTIVVLFSMIEYFTKKMRFELDSKKSNSINLSDLQKSKLDITKQINDSSRKIQSIRIIIENVLLLLYKHLNHFDEIIHNETKNDYAYTQTQHDKLKNDVGKLNDTFLLLKKLSYDVESEFINVLVDKIYQII